MNDTASAAPVRDYPPLPDFETVEQHIYGACRRYITQDMLEPIHNLIRDVIDADRAMRAQAAPAAVASPLTKLQRKAIAVCFTSDKVSVSEVQRKLSISYADAQTLCQSIVDLGLTDELELAPSLKRGAPAPHPAPVAQGDAEDAALIEALERVYLWMDRQSDAQSKGGHATFDLMMLREERDAVKAAIDAARAAQGESNG